MTLIFLLNNFESGGGVFQEPKYQFWKLCCCKNRKLDLDIISETYFRAAMAKLCLLLEMENVTKNCFKQVIFRWGNAKSSSPYEAEIVMTCNFE